MLRKILLCSAMLSASAQGQAEFGASWTSYNNSFDAQRFSSLQQINKSNANQLGEVCRVQIDGPASFHAGLVVKEGIVYTGTARETLALDARSCEVLWKYTRNPVEGGLCTGSNRGVALLNGRVFRGTCDGHLIALDAQNGEVLWDNQIALSEKGESTSAAPLAWQNMVFMGIGGSELGVRGRVLAFDATTGKELWRFNTIPMGKEIGAETWERPQTAKTGGGGVWGVMSLDISTGELFVPVGNPWPDIDAGYRPGNNLFTNSIVVLNAFTGNLRWWHQVAPADWKDLDLVAAPTLYRAQGAQDYLAIGGKDGYVTVVDRDSRTVVFRTPVTTVEDIYDKPSKEGTRMCPGYAGGVEWNGAALDKINDALIVGAVDICFIVTLGDAVEYTPGNPEFGGTIEPDGPTTGWITALDKLTGNIRWQHHTIAPVVAGITPTAGGVTLAGDLAGNFFVFDSATGNILHEMYLGGAMAGGLVTYEIDQEQYIAAAVGNISRNAFGDAGLPSVVVMKLSPEMATKITSSGNDQVQGRQLYAQVCASCHGSEGNFIADHRISNLATRQSLAETIAIIKNPAAPMPKLYPNLLDDEAIEAVAKFVHDSL